MSLLIWFVAVVAFAVCGMRKFPAQGSNQHHNSDPTHSSDNVGFLTTRAPGNSRAYLSREEEVCGLSSVTRFSVK